MSYDLAATSDDITVGTVALPATGTLQMWVNGNVGHSGNLAVLFYATDGGAKTFEVTKLGGDSLIVGWNGVSDDRTASAALGTVEATWKHYLVTWDDAANATKVYVNGSQSGIGNTSTLTTFTTTAAKTIGNVD